MMTSAQVATITTFFQIMGAWMIVFQLIPAWLGSRDGVRRKSPGGTLLLFYLFGFAVILLISGAWYVPEGRTSYSKDSILFPVVSFVLYLILAAIKSLPEAKHLKVAAFVTWLLVTAITWNYCETVGIEPWDPRSWRATATLYSPLVTITILALFLAVFVASDWVEAFMKRWSDPALTEQGLPSAGKWIGRFERFLIVCCLLANQPTGIAILVTAKGILRFGEIKNDEDQQHQRKMVEYILIGSMCSYSIALSIGWIAGFLIQHLRY